MTDHPDIAQLSAHLDEELDTATTARISAHLLGCRVCQQSYRDLRELSMDLRQLAAPHPALDVAALLERLPDRQPQQKRTHRRWARLLPGAAAAASLVLGLVIGAGLQSPASDALEPAFSALAILDSTPPGALCRQPELCYLQGRLR